MATLQEMIDQGQVLILDGPMGSELQRRGAPMHDVAWCGVASLTNPDIVREVHQEYIRAGADIITTNTFATARIVLERAGLGDRVRETNTRSVALAQEAKERASTTRPVFIAGSISSWPGPKASAEQVQESYHEQAELLAEEGVDLLLLEMMRDIQHTSTAVKAAVATGLPTWVGFSVEAAPDGSTVALLHTQQQEMFERALELIMPLGGSLVAVMHSFTECVASALQVVTEHWSGPKGAYAHSGEFIMPNWQFENIIAPQDYLAEARKWVEMGAQVIGSCCGTGPEHIRLLREKLPERIPSARTA